MAAASDNNGMFRPAGSPPLGAILVQRGVLSEEQLAAALAEQEKSGEQLGEIIVRLGFAAGPMIAQALATQYGRLLKTEYGYAVGFDGVAPGPVSPAPVGSLPAQDEQPTAPTPAAGLRVAPPAQSVPAPASADVPATPAAAATPTLDEVVLKWRQQTRQLEAQRDAALRDLQTVAAERAASAAELQAVKACCAELEAAAAQAEAAARDSELEAELTAAREESARIQREKGALEAAYESVAAHNADLEERLKQLEGANARTAQLEQQLEETGPQIAPLEAERNIVPALAQVPSEEQRERHPDEHAEDLSHLLFVAGREGYRLVAQNGPPPIPGSTLELPEDDGTSSRLLVLKVGPAPLPSVRLACAYLVEAE